MATLTQQVFSGRGKPRRNPLCEPFYAVQLNEQDKELVPYSVHSPPEVSTCLVFLLTQTNKRCIRGLLTNNEKPANNTCNRENIWNNSFVTKSMLIFINLQTTNACMSSRPTSGWQSKLCLHANYLNVLLAGKRPHHDLDTDGLNTTLSLETSIVWVVIILLTPEFLNYWVVWVPSCRFISEISQ